MKLEVDNRIKKRVETTFTIKGKRYLFQYRLHEDPSLWYYTGGFGWSYIERPFFEKIICKMISRFENPERFATLAHIRKACEMWSEVNQPPEIEDVLWDLASQIERGEHLK